MTGWLVLMTGGIMAVVVTQVRQEISDTLEHQIKERGLALARNLAGSCVEPMQLPEERTLSLMLLVKEYVQTGGGLRARNRLLTRKGLGAQVWEYVKRFGQEVETKGLRNEGVLSTVVVDAAGQIAAYADAVQDQAQWFEQIDRLYRPEIETGLVGPGDEFKIWNSRARNGMYLIAVPILIQPLSGGQETQAQYYGSVYLAMSQGLVERTVARAVAYLVLMAVGLAVLGMIVGIFIAAALTKPIRLLQSGVQAIAAGDFNKRISLKRSDEIGELTDAFNEMAKGLAERETMRGAFSSYVSADLLTEIIKNPDVMKPGGTRRVATVMFTYFGIHDELAAMTERMDPEALVRIINDYLELEVRLVTEHKGYPDKFIGDAVVAVWGVPLETADHAEKAVRCAAAIKQVVAELNEQRARQGLITTEISIGVNTGPLVVGSMGSEGKKLDYTVIGENVNFAARLAGAGATIHGGSIWIGETTYEFVKSMAQIKDLGPMEFKGLGARPVKEVLGVKEN